MASRSGKALPAQASERGASAIQIEFAGLALTLDSSGAAYLNAHDTLIVSDLHLEKGSAAASRGRLLPALDSRDTLMRLRRAVEAYRPERTVCLGDSFHDGFAGERMAEADKEELGSLRASVREWIWIGGNHDPDVPPYCGGQTLPEFKAGPVTLRHEPGLLRTGAQIAGHLHPKVSVPAGGYRFSGRCFCVWDGLVVLPAFGAFAGGLSCADPAIRSLDGQSPKLFMLHAAKVWRVA